MTVRKLATAIAVTLIAVASLISIPTTAFAAVPWNGKDVHVDWTEVGNPSPNKDPYRLNEALWFVDGYTGSRFVMDSKPCTSRDKLCIKFSFASSGPGCPAVPRGYTRVACTASSADYSWSWIYLNRTELNKYSSAARKYSVVHEMGHARGISSHNSKCTSVMYYKGTSCRLTFTYTESKTLRAH